VSKAEQKRRFIARLDRPHKEWKFNAADVAERQHWDEYIRAFDDALSATSTPWAPWFVVPADHKALTQAIVVRIIVDALAALDIKYPEVSDEQRRENAEARRVLEAEPA